LRDIAQTQAWRGLWPVAKPLEPIGAARRLCGLIRRLKNLVPEASKRRDYA
jgi:hypothetical protein